MRLKSLNFRIIRMKNRGSIALSRLFEKIGVKESARRILKGNEFRENGLQGVKGTRWKARWKFGRDERGVPFFFSLPPPPFSIAYPGIRFFNTSVALSLSLTVLLYFPLPRKKREKENRRRGGFLIGESEIGRPLDRTRAHLVQRFLPAFFSR